jgi:DNA-binding NtrC family response regulator
MGWHYYLIYLCMKTNEVLVIDDDNDLCRIITAILRCPVHVEHTLTKAEVYLVGFKPLVILLDNNLPDGKGIEFIKEILKVYPDIKIILMTSDSSEGLKEKAYDEGAVSFIAKPFKASLLNEVLGSICPDLKAA